MTIKKPIWIIEEKNLIGDDDSIRLKEEVLKQGYIVETIGYCPLKDTKDFDRLLLKYLDDCVVFYGSIHMALLFKQFPGYPCTFLNSNYHYSHFTSNLKSGCKFLFNNDYYLLPIGVLRSKKESIYNHSTTCFMRPDSGFKPFDGQLVSYYEFDSFVNFLSSKFFPEDLVVISTFKTPQREYRLLIHHDEIVTGSLYYVNGKHEVGPVEKHIYDGAKTILKDQMNPIDSIYFMDVTFNNVVSKTVSLLEYSSVSCAGLYNIDLTSFVQHVSEESIKCYNNSCPIIL